MTSHLPIWDMIENAARNAQTERIMRALHQRRLDDERVLDLTNILGSMWFGRVQEEIDKFTAEIMREPEKMKMRYCHAVDLCRQSKMKVENITSLVHLFGIPCTITEMPVKGAKLTQIVVDEYQGMVLA